MQAKLSIFLEKSFGARKPSGTVGGPCLKDSSFLPDGTIDLFRKHFTFSIRSFHDNELSHCCTACSDTMQFYRGIYRSLTAVVAQPNNCHLKLTLRMSSKV